MIIMIMVIIIITKVIIKSISIIQIMTRWSYRHCSYIEKKNLKKINQKNLTLGWALYSQTPALQADITT